jgi:hypothetical protein
MRGGLRTDIRRAERDYLPLTAEVVAPHTSRNKRIALYPLGGDWVLEVNFDGPDAMIDALMYPEAARTPGVRSACAAAAHCAKGEGPVRGERTTLPRQLLKCGLVPIGGPSGACLTLRRGVCLR